MDEHWLPNERANVIRAIFGVFGLCIIDGSPYLTIAEDAATWDVDGLQLGYRSFRGTYSPTIREWIQLIRHRDSMVRYHLGVLIETPEATTYRVTNDPANFECNESAPLIRWPRH
jgi:hypothetical protein